MRKKLTEGYLYDINIDPEPYGSEKFNQMYFSHSDEFMFTAISKALVKCEARYAKDSGFKRASLSAAEKTNCHVYGKPAHLYHIQVGPWSSPKLIVDAFKNLETACKLLLKEYVEGNYIKAITYIGKIDK